jgi:hypothetical protein
MPHGSLVFSDNAGHLLSIDGIRKLDFFSMELHEMIP